MSKIFFSLGILAIMLISSCENNHYAPNIIDFDANPERVLVNTNVTLSCLAADGDGDAVAYFWEADYGTFLHGSSGTSVVWKSPDTEGEYMIQVTVGDGELYTRQSLKVVVYEELPLEGTFEYAGREYAFSTMGSQTWMVDNLAYLPTVSQALDGADDYPFYYVYEYNGSTVDIAKTQNNYEDYGVLYNWEAAMIACPDGWHVPSDEEWKTLERYLGMLSSQVDDLDWRAGGSVGRKLKSASGWRDDGNGDNSSNFNALPGGLKSYSGKFSDLQKYGNYWSSTPGESFEAWYRYLGYKEDGVNRNTSSKRRGFSVRCIRDQE